MEAVDARLSLRKLDAEQAALCERIATLTPDEREAPSNLANWSVNDLAVHITRVCDSISRAIERGLEGDRTPAFGPAAKPREDEIRAMTPRDWAALQRSEYARIAATIGACTDTALEDYSFPHPQGERPLSWYCTQLLSETAFHRWDLEYSLGADKPLDDELGAYLLPFLLEPTRQLFGAKKSPDATQSFIVATPEARWQLDVSGDGCVVASSADSATDTITASPGWLALAVYGRVRVDRPEFEVTGSRDVADRFAAIFGPDS
jgi:uncharacterized protein (TIGR03083 family)